jgi:hypothetical protein
VRAAGGRRRRLRQAWLFMMRGFFNVVVNVVVQSLADAPCMAAPSHCAHIGPPPPSPPPRAPLAAEHHSIHGGRGKHGLWGMGSTLVLHNKRRWAWGWRSCLSSACTWQHCYWAWICACRLPLVPPLRCCANETAWLPSLVATSGLPMWHMPRLCDGNAALKAAVP